MSNEVLTKMWSGRFSEPLNSSFESWQRSFPFDFRLYKIEVLASIAHARTIAAAGILTPEELTRITAGLKAAAPLELKPRELPAEPEDVHHFVELALTQQIGDLPSSSTLAAAPMSRSPPTCACALVTRPHHPRGRLRRAVHATYTYL